MESGVKLVRLRGLERWTSEQGRHGGREGAQVSEVVAEHLIDLAVIDLPIHMHEQVAEPRHPLEALSEIERDDTRLAQRRKARRVVLGCLSQSASRHVIAERQGGLDPDEQAVTRDVQGIPVGEKIRQAQLRNPLEALNGFLDLTATRANDVGVERHAPNASAVLRRSSGAMSK